MNRYIILFGTLLAALAASCQPQVEDVAEETSQTTVTSGPPKTAAECEQQLLVLLSNPVCSAGTQAKQTERHQHLMRDFDRMAPQRPLTRLPRAQ